MATEGVSIALACRASGVSETCFRYSPRRDAGNGFIADLLEGLTRAHRTWGFGPCFLHMRNVQGGSHEPPLVQGHGGRPGTTSVSIGSTASLSSTSRFLPERVVRSLNPFVGETVHWTVS